MAEQFAALGGPFNVRTSVIVGGMDMIQQAKELENRPHVVVATPGRMVDHLRSTSGDWDLSRVKFLVIVFYLACFFESSCAEKVLDEADRLLTPTFASELAVIFNALPSERQTSLFTATISEKIEAIANAPPKPGKSPPFVHRITDRLVFEPLMKPIGLTKIQDRDGINSQAILSTRAVSCPRGLLILSAEQSSFQYPSPAKGPTRKGHSISSWETTSLKEDEAKVNRGVDGRRCRGYSAASNDHILHAPKSGRISNRVPESPGYPRDCFALATDPTRTPELPQSLSCLCGAGAGFYRCGSERAGHR